MISHPLTQRHVIPRWRPHAVALSLGELRASKEPREKGKVPPALLAEKLAAWKKHGTRSFASELVTTAMLAQQAEVALDAAKFILSTEAQASLALRKVATRLLTGADIPDYTPADELVSLEHIRDKISSIRRRLVEHYNNPLLLHDLAYFYGLAGQLKRARHFSSIALKLAPENRFLLRSTARLLIHAGAIDEALDVLRKSERLRYDPWLMAAEIATADLAGTTSRWVRQGLRVVESGKWPPFHTSELAGAVASIELDAGAVKRSRKLFATALEDPTENVVAQAEWTVNNRHLQRPPNLRLEAPGAFEAKSIESYFKGDWERAMEQAWLWCLDQPFSVHATSWGSFVASVVLENHTEAIKIAKIGIAANPTNWVLRNNHAFSLIHTGQTEAAETELANAHPSAGDREATATLLATKGLLSYRIGDTDAGRAMYGRAVEIFEEARNAKCSLLARIYWVLEEAKVDGPLTIQLAQSVARDAKTFKSPDIDILMVRLKDALKSANIVLSDTA